MSLIVRPRNAASAARLTTNVLAGAAGMLAGGAYRKAQAKATDLVLKGAQSLKDRFFNSDSQANRQVSRGRTRRRGKATGESTVDILSQSAPATAYFAGTPRITFGISGRAQTNVEMGDNGVRIVGSDVFPLQVESNGADASAPFKSPSGGANQNIVWLDPAAVSARLSQFMQMYTFYAFRKLRFWYMPVVGTSTGGAIALSITQDLYSNQASNSLAKILQNQHSTITEVWRPVTVEISHRGTKVFSPYTSNSVPFGDRYQFELDGCFTSALAAAVYGVIFVDYEIDFYSPQFTHSGYTLLKQPTTNVNSLGPINESSVNSQPCDKEEKKGEQVISATREDTVSGSFAQNGTGANCVMNPTTHIVWTDSNGSGLNSNLNGGYTVGSNGTGNNPVIPLTQSVDLSRSITRRFIGTNGHQ